MDRDVHRQLQARTVSRNHPHITAAICPRWTYFFNSVYQMDQDGHVRYVRQSEQYQKSLHPQCLLFHSSVYRRNHCTEYKIKSCTFLLKEIHPKMSSSKRPPCNLGMQCVCIRSIHRYVTGVFVNTMLRLVQKRQNPYYCPFVRRIHRLPVNSSLN